MAKPIQSTVFLLLLSTTMCDSKVDVTLVPWICRELINVEEQSILKLLQTFFTCTKGYKGRLGIYWNSIDFTSEIQFYFLTEEAPSSQLIYSFEPPRYLGSRLLSFICYLLSVKNWLLTWEVRCCNNAVKSFKNTILFSGRGSFRHTLANELFQVCSSIFEYSQLSLKKKSSFLPLLTALKSG